MLKGIRGELAWMLAANITSRELTSGGSRRFEQWLVLRVIVVATENRLNPNIELLLAVLLRCTYMQGWYLAIEHVSPI